MKIRKIEIRKEALPLTRPYAVAYRMIDTIDNVFVRLETDDGKVGLGACAPEEFVTGENVGTCVAALDVAMDELVGRDVLALLEPGSLLDRRFREAPAARAALDIALHDLAARAANLPLVKWLGQVHSELPTSITIGIKDVAETLAEADEYLGRGFEVLKLKLGEGVAVDVERTRKLREHVGFAVKIRVDVNQAYSAAELLDFVEQTADLALEFLEQPLPAEAVAEMRGLPDGVRQVIAIDESLLTPDDAVRLSEEPKAGQIFNIKLMKCGGIGPARRIAAVAQNRGIDLMWGCMDESRISIAAALHAAFACPATRFLDLDGHLDLARDVVEGGFTLEKGRMRLDLARIGLGVREL